ncbi:MAG TPA: hypothetical protein VEZ20_05790 [Allosphingosinicella sp.]|nr:hypothetical protein [Allosphingosinicella sp.]
MPFRTYGARKYAGAGIAAAAILAAQPCAAADDFRDRRAPETRSGGFAGISLRMPLDEGRSRRPTARLQLTTMTSSRDAAGAVTFRFARGVELGADRRGRAALSIGGQDVRGAEERLGIGGSTTTLLIVGGVVLVVAVLATVAAATPRPGPNEGAFD